MSRAPRRAILLAAVLALSLPASVLATHSWGGYHWARTANPFTVKLGDNVTSAWDGSLATASGAWSVSSVLDTSIVPGSVSRPKQCRATVGTVQVCNATYGNNGWLGVASISITGGTHITQGTVKVNDTYFKTSTYNKPEWRTMVMCQEIGHTLGLDHQDTTFGNQNLGTCMDYTNDPSTNQYPNQHDYAQLETIYAHLDSTTTLASVPATPAASAAAAAADAAAAESDAADAAWGALVELTDGGRGAWYVRDLGAGNLILTHVLWADR